MCIRDRDWSADIPAEIVAKITEAEGKMLAGEFSPFTGPITDQSGAEKVAAGVVLGDDMILSMDWHVKGVTSPLPKYCLLYTAGLALGWMARRPMTTPT